jgi:hypothetical protein
MWVLIADYTCDCSLRQFKTLESLKSTFEKYSLKGKWGIAWAFDLQSGQSVLLDSSTPLPVQTGPSSMSQIQPQWSNDQPIQQLVKQLISRLENLSAVSESNQQTVQTDNATCEKLLEQLLPSLCELYKTLCKMQGHKIALVQIANVLQSILLRSGMKFQQYSINTPIIAEAYLLQWGLLGLFLDRNQSEVS